MKQRYYIAYILLWIIIVYWFYRVVFQNQNQAPEQFAVVSGSFSVFEIGKPYYIIEAYETLKALTYDKDTGEVILAPYPVDNELQQWIPVRDGTQDLKSTTHKYCATTVLQPGIQYGTSFLLKNKSEPVYLNVYYDTTNRMIGYNVFTLNTITINTRVVNNLDSPIFTDPVEDRARCAQLGTSSAPELLRPQCTLTDYDVRDNWVIDTPAVPRRCTKYKPRPAYVKAKAVNEGQWLGIDCDGGDITNAVWWYGAPEQKTKCLEFRGRAGCYKSAPDGYGNWWSQELWQGSCRDPGDILDCRWTGPGGDRAGSMPPFILATGWRNACNGAKSCAWPVTNAEWHNDPVPEKAKISEVRWKCQNTPGSDGITDCEAYSVAKSATYKNDKIYTPYCKICKLFTGNYNRVTCADTTNNIREAQKFSFANNELQLMDKLTTTGDTTLNIAASQYIGLTSEDKLTLLHNRPGVFYFVAPASRAEMHAQYMIKNQSMAKNTALETQIYNDVRGSLQSS